MDQKILTTIHSFQFYATVHQSPMKHSVTEMVWNIHILIIIFGAGQAWWWRLQARIQPSECCRAVVLWTSWIHQFNDSHAIWANENRSNVPQVQFVDYSITIQLPDALVGNSMPNPCNFVIIINDMWHDALCLLVDFPFSRWILYRSPQKYWGSRSWRRWTVYICLIIQLTIDLTVSKSRQFC